MSCVSLSVNRSPRVLSPTTTCLREVIRNLGNTKSFGGFCDWEAKRKACGFKSRGQVDLRTIVRNSNRK